MTIKLDKLRFSYPEDPDRLVIDIPNWEVDDSEQVFVHGPSGCGKSTLLNLLGGLLPASAGELIVLGERLDRMSLRQRDRFRANYIGYVFQQFNLVPYLNAIENVQLATHFSKGANKRQTASEIESLLSRLSISEADRAKPTSKLSIGQQQRVAIARALINKPQVLIADEPTSSLDQSNRDNFMSELVSLVESENISLVFVSHDMSLSKYFQRVDSLVEINRAGEANRCL